jgi:NADH:ubiquinone oxidoreductase subunit 5 (subunit L)/multisubunit Na+/H+ antiporter MnhA subunit
MGFNSAFKGLNKLLIIMCAGSFTHSMRDSQDIHFIGSLSVCIPFISSLMVSNFALCATPFLSCFYSMDFTLEMFSVCYINRFGLFKLFLSTGLRVCYSLRLYSCTDGPNISAPNATTQTSSPSDDKWNNQWRHTGLIT